MDWKTFWKAALTVALFIGAWWLFGALSHNHYFPTPLDTVRAFVDLLKDTKTYTHIGYTFYRTLVGTAVGMAVGVVLGISTRYSEFMDTVVRIVIYPLFQSFPPICWALVFVLFFGLSNMTPILTIVTVVAPFFMINIWEGLKDIDYSLVEMASTYTNKRFRILSHVVMPMLNPYLFDAIKNGVTVAWKAVILGELYGSIKGMGYMMNMAFHAYHMAQVFAWTIFFVIILLVIDKVFFTFLERRFIRQWKTARVS